MKTKTNKPNEKKRSSSPFFSSQNNSGFFNAQTKLNVGKPNDKYEKEADRVADTVVLNSQDKKNNISFDSAMSVQQKPEEFIHEKPLVESITPLVQKQEEEIQTKQIGDLQKQEEKPAQTQVKEKEEPIQMQEEEEMLQPKQNKSSGDQSNLNRQNIASPNVENKLKSRGGNGNKIDASTRSKMENNFGADFSRVNIHTDSEAVQMNKELGAQAFTNGNDIYFNKGKYNPGSNEGKHLLAHELTHTIQQKGKAALNLQFFIGDNNDLQSARFANNIALEACLDGERTLHFGSNGRPVSIMQQALVDAGFPLPVYGVDGIFEAETRGALQNFQRSSSVPATGILDSASMSSLDALFTFGAPILPTGNPANIVPTITSETIKFAPDGAADTRTTIGVGERIRFTGNTAGVWTVSEGRIIGINNGGNMVWEAPPIASSPTITLTTPGGAASKPMTVIAPNSLSMTVNNNPPIPSGTLGADMMTDLVVHPLNVNFGRTQWFEVPRPATNVTGYWSSYTAAQLFHGPNPNYLPFDDFNSGLQDHAAWRGGSRPFSAGTHDWVIPNRYKIDGESDAQGRFFTNTTQSFYITATGTIMITKAGALVIRTINNNVF